MVEDERARPMTDELVTTTDDLATAIDRNGRRRRARQTERIAHAVEAVVRALEPLDGAARVRVLRATAALLDMPVSMDDIPAAAP
jgi:hypothetical protein